MNISATNKIHGAEKDPEIYELVSNYTSIIGLDYYEILINKIIGNPKFEKYLKEIMEKQIYSYWINNISEVIHDQENPFDSIYLADLSPDRVGKKGVQLVVSLSNQIEDRSCLISFNDDLED